MVQVIKQLSCCAVISLAIAMFGHRLKVSYKSLKSTESCVIKPKVLHHFDNSYPIVLIAGHIFSTAFLMLADYMPFLRYMIHREMYVAIQDRNLST